MGINNTPHNVTAWNDNGHLGTAHNIYQHLPIYTTFTNVSVQWMFLCNMIHCKMGNTQKGVILFLRSCSEPDS